jgi:hypothetical protein
MAHRLRYAAANGPFAGMLEGTLEIDETYVGGKTKNDSRLKKERKGKTGMDPDKTPVGALVERGTGRVRAFPMMGVTSDNIGKAIERWSCPQRR